MQRRVLIIVQNLPVPLDRRVWLECQALRDAGYIVSVICPKGPGDRPYHKFDGIHLYKYDAPPEAEGLMGYLREFVVCWLKTARISLRVRREVGFDVIQVCNPPDTYAVLALLYRAFGVRLVYDQHDLCPEVYQSRFGHSRGLLYRGLLALERITYSTADRVISTNESYRQVAIRRGRRRPEDVTVVRSGPDTTRMRRGSQEAELKRGRRHLAVYLGIMGPQDGVENVLYAIDLLVRERRRTDIHFALLGFGDCLPALLDLSLSLEINEFVTFTGRANFETLHRYLSTADVGLCPDPLSPLNDVSTMNKIMEYMAYELPVVGFDLKESRVSAGEAGTFVPSGDVPAFASAVESLLDNAASRTGMGQLGRARAVELLDWRMQAANYVNVYHDLFGRGRIRSAPPLRNHRTLQSEALAERLLAGKCLTSDASDHAGSHAGPEQDASWSAR